MTRRTFVAFAAAAAAQPATTGFTLGLYSLPRHADAWTRVREAGFNVVHQPARRDALDTAHKHGLKAWVTTGIMQPKSKPADEARIRKLVGDLKAHPALAFWETVDEPTYEWRKPAIKIPPQPVQETYRLIKALDPARPVYLNHAPTNLVSTLQSYNPCADILATDIYPVIPHGIRPVYGLWEDGRQGDLLNTHISQVGQYADKMRQVAGPDRAVFLVLQGFAWERTRAKDQNPAHIVEPSPAQQRFMAWQAIVHGVNGLLYWGLHTTPAESRLWDDLAVVSREITGFREELSAAPLRPALKLEYHDTGHSLDRGIEWLMKPSRGGALLIAVNADPNPVEVTFQGLAGPVRVVGESRTIAQPVRDRFAPFGVHLYEAPRR